MICQVSLNEQTKNNCEKYITRFRQNLACYKPRYYASIGLKPEDYENVFARSQIAAEIKESAIRVFCAEISEITRTEMNLAVRGKRRYFQKLSDWFLTRIRVVTENGNSRLWAPFRAKRISVAGIVRGPYKTKTTEETKPTAVFENPAPVEPKVEPIPEPKVEPKVEPIIAPISEPKVEPIIEPIPEPTEEEKNLIQNLAQIEEQVLAPAPEPLSEPIAENAVGVILAQFPKTKSVSRSVDSHRPLSTKNLLTPVELPTNIPAYVVSDETVELLEKKIAELRVASDFRVVAAELLKIPFLKEFTRIRGFMGIKSKYCYEIPTTVFTHKSEEEYSALRGTIIRDFFVYELAVGETIFRSTHGHEQTDKYVFETDIVLNGDRDNLELFLRHKLAIGELTGVEHLENYLTAAKLRNDGTERKLLQKAVARKIWDMKVDNELEEVFRPGRISIVGPALEFQDGQDLVAREETKHPLTGADEYTEFSRYAEISNIENSVAYMQIEKNGRPVIRYRQYNNESSANIARLLQASSVNTGTYCELIEDDCRFFCDIDDQRNTIKNFREVIESFAALFENCFRQYMGYGDEIEVSREILFPSPWRYNSAHIVFKIICDGEELVAENAKAQRDFWYKYSKAFFGKHSHFLDLSVYRPRTTLRMPFAYKNGQALVSENDKFEIEDALVNPPRDIATRTVAFCKYARQYFWSEHEQNVLLAHINRSNTWIGQQLSKEGESVRYDNYHRFLEIIVSAFWNRGVQYCCKLASEISPDERLEKIMAELFSNRPHVSLEQALKFFPGQLMFTETKSISDGINYEKIFAKIKSENPRAVIIKSGCNTRKTYNFMAANRKRVLYIVHRVSLANDYFETFKSLGIQACHYKDYDEMAKVFAQHGDAPIKFIRTTECGGKLFVPINFVCVVNSLHKIGPLLKYYDEVFIDECCAVFRQLNLIAKNESGLCTRAFESVLEEIMTKKNITVVSANVGAETFNVFDYYGRKIDYALHNVFLDKSKYNYIAYHTGGLWLAKVYEFLAEGKRICVPCNNAKYGATLAEDITKKYGVRVLVISRDNKTEFTRTSHWMDYDVVIYTPTIDSGVSFVPEYFDYICGYFQAGINSSDACFQALWRVRNPGIKTIHVYVERTYAPAYDTFFDEKELIYARAKTFSMGRNTEENKGKKGFRNALQELCCESVFGSGLVREKLRPMEKILLDNDAYAHHDKDHFSQTFLSFLNESGMEGIIVFEQKATKTIRTIVNGNYTEGNDIAKKLGVKKRAVLKKNTGFNAHVFSNFKADKSINLKELIVGKFKEQVEKIIEDLHNRAVHPEIYYPTANEMLCNIACTGVKISGEKLIGNLGKIMETVKSMPGEAKKLAMISKIDFCMNYGYKKSRAAYRRIAPLKDEERKGLPEKDLARYRGIAHFEKISKDLVEIARLLKRCEGQSVSELYNYVEENYERFCRCIPSRTTIATGYHWGRLGDNQKENSIAPRLRPYGITFVVDPYDLNEKPQKIVRFKRTTEIGWLVDAIAEK